MRKMKYFLSLATFLLLVQGISAWTGKYSIQNFSTKDYKAGIQNIDFAQNRDMSLFVANNLGVLSFNGEAWNLHNSNTGKKQRSLAFDESTNRLYVGSQGEFGFFQDNWNYISLKELVPKPSQDFDEVWDVFLSNSRAYFCTFQAIYVYDGQSIKVIDHKDGFDRSFQVKEKLFVQTQKGVLFEIKEDQLIPTFNLSQKNQVVRGIVPENEGFLIFYDSGNIEFSNSFSIISKYDALINALRGKYVNHVLQLSDTRLAISTQTSGIYLYDLQNQTIDNITTRDGLLTNACLRTFQDFTGNLWVGMQNGIALININSPMRLINQEIDLQGSGYEAYEAQEGSYFTTSNGIYFLAKNNSQSVFLKGTEGPAYSMQEINGKIYAGHHTGLFLLENGLAERIASTNGLWHIKALRSKPGFAIGGTYSGLYLFKINGGRRLQAIREISGFNESSRFFEEDQKGRIWVGQFYKGLYQLSLSEELREATVKKMSDENDFPKVDQVLLSRVNNELYLATDEGLYKIDQSTDKITEAKEFSKDIGKQPVYLFVQDQQNNVFLFAENKVGFFKQISANNYLFLPSSLSQLRYSFNNDLLNVSVNVNNGVLLNANEGFIHYDPDLENRVAVKKPLLVNKIYSVAEDSVLFHRPPFLGVQDNTLSFNISPKSKVLQFQVESFQFQDMSNRQFQFFLKGFDEDFGEWSSTTNKEYTNLREGNYEFVVNTKNHLGEITSSSPVLIKVKPPLHRSLLAKIFYVVFGFLALLSASRFQRGRYKQKAKEIEKTKQYELAKKQEKLIEIEQQKEEELKILEEEKMKSELRHINNLLAASTMNLVVKNEFIENIKEKLNEVKRNGKNMATKQSLDQIVKEIDTTLRLQEDWSQFEHHFDQVHGDFSTRLRNEFIDLSPNEQKLCVFLRLNLNSKEIANLMGISLRGVEVARYRLRKKLRLAQGQNLSKFILEY